MHKYVIEKIKKKLKLLEEYDKNTCCELINLLEFIENTQDLKLKWIVK